MQSLECVELFAFVLQPEMSVPDITNLGYLTYLHQMLLWMFIAKNVIHVN